MPTWQHIPQADILAEDLPIFDQNQEPQIGGICIIPFSEDWLLVRLVSQDEDGFFFWISLGYDEKTNVFCKIKTDHLG